jgi:hypothetical protein
MESGYGIGNQSLVSYFHVFEAIAFSGTVTVIEFMLLEYIFFRMFFWFRLALLFVGQQVHSMDSTMVSTVLFMFPLLIDEECFNVLNTHFIHEAKTS